MARQTQGVEVNQFSGGLITDASPLTTPDNSSLDGDNIVLNIDGSQNRRLGLDYETGWKDVDTSVEDADSVNIAITTYRWDNAGGDPETSIEVVQTGTELKLFHLGDDASISSSLFNTQTFPSASELTKFSYAVVDGILVISTGEKEVYLLEYDAPNTITRTSKRLLVRDFFGVEDISGGQDISRGNAISVRPTSLTQPHTYNLRNQSWGVSRLASNAETLADPITHFQSVASRYPSNSDTVNEALYNDANDADNRTVDRFFARDLFNNPLGTGKAAQGYFIIDALDRGASRIAEYAKNMTKYPNLSSNVTTLPTDSTTAGPTAITEFSGRVWYAGFPGTVIGPDASSPKMSSYVLFSKVVDSIADINVCYQEGDPTSKTAPDIIDTDGGFIRINEAYGIQKLINLGSSLMVVASNGVWRIVGGTDNGFTATQYIVEKITDRGCTSFDSIAVVDASFMFWADDGIYHVNTDQFGTWVCNNISFARIQRFYDDINVESKRNAKGLYDSYERKVRWIYNNYTTTELNTRELILDVQLGAYYTNTIARYQAGTRVPKVVSMYLGLPYAISSNEADVIVGIEPVLIGIESVVVSSTERLGTSQRELGYLVITATEPTLEFTFAKYTNTDFRDWFSENNVGVDAEAFTITSYLSGGDFQRSKQVTYITTHMRRTETGYDDMMNAVNPSSCLVQARWGWSNSDSSGKWGREFQAYRYRRLHLPLNPEDDLDNGFSTVVTRSKLRGSGRVLSLRFRSEPYKNLHIYGWSLIFSVEENV